MGSSASLMVNHPTESFSYQQEREQHYAVIGAALLHAEAKDMHIGIPWLLPTARVRALRAIDSLPDLTEMMKQELVTVNTKSLETYCDDLETLPDLPGSTDCLHIKLNSRSERYGFGALLTVFFAICLALFSFPLYQDVGTSILLGLIGGLVGLLVGLNMSSDRSRRASFAILITREILRRQGLDGNDKDRLRLSSVDPKPIK